jgi:CDP-diacylglycerol--inositol 3-phosphatidyltransferase
MVTATKVLFYYPNLIGYIRIICMIVAFYYAKIDWKITVISYLLAFCGDVVDGFVARAFNQCSNYGGILDMVTDRVSTCGLLVILTHFYENYTFVFIMLIVLDISSHWFHVLSVQKHHKSDEALVDRNVFLRWYYGIYPLFGYCCVGTEVFYVCLYVLHFYTNPLLRQICYFGCLPACIMKQLVNVVQLISASYAIAEQDAHDFNENNRKKN